MDHILNVTLSHLCQLLQKNNDASESNPYTVQGADWLLVSRCVCTYFLCDINNPPESER